VLAHVLAGEPDPTSPGHALGEEEDLDVAYLARVGKSLVEMFKSD
jgi:hypothetical protein